MDDEFPSEVGFTTGEVVGRIEIRVLVRTDLEQSRHDFHDARHHGQAIQGGVMDRPFHVIEIGLTRLRMKVEVV